MVAMVKRLDARSFCFHPQLSVFTFLALVLKVCRNRLRCHGQSVAGLAPPKLSNFGHSDRACRRPAFTRNALKQGKSFSLEKTPILCALQAIDRDNFAENVNQLILFDF